jgi:hypothetical protein
MKHSRRALAVFAAAAALACHGAARADDPARAHVAPTQLAQTHYYVYCANGKIEVDSRNPEQMRSARGSDTCMFSRFNYLSDAQSFAQKNFGGPGKKCSCR